MNCIKSKIDAANFIRKDSPFMVHFSIGTSPAGYILPVGTVPTDNLTLKIKQLVLTLKQFNPLLLLFFRWLRHISHDAKWKI